MPDFPWPAPGWPNKGDKLVFLAANGFASELESAYKLLHRGQVLTVLNCEIRSWSSRYEFEEFPGRWFNTVMFRPVTEEPPALEPRGSNGKLVHGNKDMIEILEDALARAKKGTLEGLLIIGCENGGSGWTGAFRDDMSFPWPRLQAAVDTAQMELLRDGTDNWNG